MSEAYLLKEHREWIGLLQPVGLVVSPTALARAQLRLQKDVFELQNELMSITDDAGLLPMHVLNLFIRVLGWRKEDLFSGDSINDLDVYLPERETLLKADFAVKNVDTQNFDILIKNVGQKNFDEDEVLEGRGWQATPHAKFERHLREKNISIGILVSQVGVRLVYAPKGETSGYLTFPFAFMRETQGRPALAALHLLLSEDRLFKGDPSQRLPALLIESRKFQNDVSNQLSEQVLAALYELLRGLQEADELSKSRLLEDVLARDKNEVYHGLLTVLLRVVFLLYSEDRDLLSNDAVFLNNYSINGLFARLREDFNKHHESLNFRFGAWAHLLSVFRLVYEGVDLESESIPGRKGHLFDPSRFPFLEGRFCREADRVDYPKISDGTVWRVLSNLMLLDGERISYRSLDVEQIGSVYETVMGFRLEIASGPSIAVRATKSNGAPIVINIDEILREKAEERAGKLKDLTDQKFDGKLGDAIRASKSPAEFVSAIDKKVAAWATPSIVGTGSMILQPSDERRRSGSHYTPRALTAPIVAKTLEPVLKKLGDSPKPDQILNLKICDPAMGSGAFLVETCRQLSDALVKSWAIYNPRIREEIPADEDELLYARRLIAQRCLYGVDRNPMAVNLAKLSLWLATFAKSHDFTFLDHCLKCGDSLVGLDVQQILGRTWELSSNLALQDASVSDRLVKVYRVREEIRLASQNQRFERLCELKTEEDKLLGELRGISEAVIYSFFAKDNLKVRKQELDRLNAIMQMWLASGVPLADFGGLAKEISHTKSSIRPFNWQIEFIEVFERSKSGFDAVVGNPPFIGGKKISSFLGDAYLDWLVYLHPETNGNVDIVAHFFRRTFFLLNEDGKAGLIATNSVAQGDTRFGGLRWINTNGGEIYFAVTRYSWPGDVSVVVSIVCFSKKASEEPRFINGRQVNRINAFLFDIGGDDDPMPLHENKGMNYTGSYIMGAGFTFDSNQTKSSASSLEVMSNILGADEKYREVIFPYIGGEEVNESPTHAPKRFVINVSHLSEEEVSLQFPLVFKILQDRVKPERLKQKDPLARDRWWQFFRPRAELYSKIKRLERVLVISRVNPHLSFTFLPSNMVYADSMIVFPSESFSLFGVLQSRAHEVWARYFSSTALELMRYAPSDCFETFPFPEDYLSNSALIDAGQAYFELRAKILVDLNIGLTELYNRFHDPSIVSPEIVRFRAQQDDLDAAVFRAFGWNEDSSGSFVRLSSENDSDAKMRYSWPEVRRDSILGRLMELNAKRALKQREAFNDIE